MERTKQKERELVCGFLKRYFDLSSLSDDDDDFIKQGLVNSLFAMQLIIFIEKTFDFAVPTEEISLDNFSTVNKIVDYISEKVND